MGAVTNPKSCEGCALYGVGRGFVMDSGNPKTAKAIMCFEAPGSQEIAFELRPQANRGFFETAKECNEEIRRRQEAFPDIPLKFLSLGAPIVGPTGQAIQRWIWEKVGIKRDELFLMNTIRCLPPKSKNGQAYPTGDARKQAEQFCRKYDRIDQFRPDTMVVTIHPAALLREIGPLPLVVKDMEKVRDFTTQGRRVMALLGGKALHAFLRYTENVQWWRGHYVGLAADWSETYKQIFDFKAKPRKERATVTRPEVLDEMPCKSAKRYKGARPPKCGCVACWTLWENKNV